MADVVSVRDGDVAQALALLTRAEAACQAMDLRGALAFNHKMRGNVLYRAGRYEEARDLYTRALAEFRDMTEPRGTALSRLGLAKARARLGRDSAETAAELDALRANKNNTDPTRKVRFLPYGIAASVLDGSPDIEDTSDDASDNVDQPE